MSRAWVARVATHGAALIIGVLLSEVFRARAIFEWDKKVSVSSLMSMVLTITISIIFFRTFERQKYSDKLKKDALLQRLGASQSALVDLEEQTDEAMLAHDRIVRTIKKMRSEFQQFIVLSSRVGYRVSLDHRKAVHSEARHVNELLTLTPRAPTADDGPLIKKGNNLLLTSARRAEVNSSLAQLKRSMVDCQTDVILDV